MSYIWHMFNEGTVADISVLDFSPCFLKQVKSELVTVARSLSTGYNKMVGSDGP
jgi:hypothetical protein